MTGPVLTPHPCRIAGRSARLKAVATQSYLSLGYNLQDLQEGNQSLLIRHGTCNKGVARCTTFSTVQQNGFGDGADVATVTVGRRVTDIPQLAGQEELRARFAVLIGASPATTARCRTSGSDPDRSRRRTGCGA